MSLLKEAKLTQALIESKVLEVDLDLEIQPSIASGSLPEFIIVGVEITVRGLDYS
mgnify:CR=1 FL=1